MTLLHELVIDSSIEHSRNKAIIFDKCITSKKLTSEHFLTYNELAQQVDEFKKVFKFLQIKNETVAICLSDCLQIPSILLGLLSCKCAFHPISPEGTLYITQSLTSSGTSWIILHSVYLKTLWDVIQCLNGEEVTSDVLDKYQLKIFSLKKVSSLEQPPDLAYCITTSGTTGSPKLVQVPHSCIVPNILHLRTIFHLGPGDRVLLTSPLTFDPSIVDIFSTLSSGACLVIIPTALKCKPEQFLHVTHTIQKITVLQATPSFLRTLTAKRLQVTLLGLESPLKCLAVGGEPFPSSSELLSWIHPDNKKTRLFNLYGVTEVSCWATCHPVDIQDLSFGHSIIPLGKPLDKTYIKIVSDSSDSEGEIWIGSQERFCLVDHEMPSLENDVYWRKTGDWGRMTSHGELVYLHRNDEQVKRMGKRLNLTAIEMILRSVSSVANCWVILRGQQLLAFIATCADNAEASREHVSEAKKSATGDRAHQWLELKKTLEETLQQCLPSHCMPDVFVQVSESLPVTINGKLDRTTLLAMYDNEIRNFHLIKSNNFLQLAKELFQSVLAVKAKDINPEDNFISLGGDSLAAMRLITSVESLLENKLATLLDVLVNRDLDTFAHHLKLYLHPNTQNAEQNPQSITETLPNSQGENSTLSCKQSTTSLGNDSVYHDSKSAKRPKLTQYSGPFFHLDTDVNCTAQRIISRGSNVIHHLPTAADTSDDCYGPCHTNNVYLKLAWKHNTGKCVDSSPLVVVYKDLTLAFIGSHSGLVMAVNVLSGLPVWSVELAGRIEASPCADLKGHYVIVGCYDGFIYVLAARTGDVVWAWVTHDMVKCTPGVNPETGHILCGSHDGHLYCLDVEKKNCVWKHNVGGGGIFSSPAFDVTQRLVFVATLTGHVAALFYDKVTVFWSIELNKPVFSSLTVCDSSVLVGCVDGQLYALSFTGQKMWTFRAEAAIFSSPVFSGSFIYVGCHDTYLYCLNKLGQLRWKFKTDATVYSTPFFEQVESQVSAAVSQTGEYLSVTTPHCSEMLGLPSTEVHNKTLADKRLEKTNILNHCHQPCQIVVAAASKGTMHLLCAHCSSVLGQLDLPAEIFSSPVIVNRQLLVGCRDNFFYCFTIT